MYLVLMKYQEYINKKSQLISYFKLRYFLIMAKCQVDDCKYLICFEPEVVYYFKLKIYYLSILKMFPLKFYFILFFLQY